jgi:hypothetical protein
MGKVKNRETSLQKGSLTPLHPLRLPPMTAFFFSCCKDFPASRQQSLSWGQKNLILGRPQKYAAASFSRPLSTLIEFGLVHEHGRIGFGVRLQRLAGFGF